MFTAHIISANVQAHPLNSALFCNISISQNQKYITMQLHYIWPCVGITPLLHTKYMSCWVLANCQGSRKTQRANSKCTTWQAKSYGRLSHQLVNSYQCWAFIFVIKQPKSPHSSDCLTLKMKRQDPSNVCNYLPIKMVTSQKTWTFSNITVSTSTLDTTAILPWLDWKNFNGSSQLTTKFSRHLHETAY